MMYANPKYDISDEVLDNLGANLSNRKSKSKPGGSTSPGSKTGSSGETPAGGTESREPKK
jgi:hypothetical protein